MIAVIDYGMGNSGSILNMLKRVGAKGVATADPAVIEQAEKLILPGVGAFDTGVRNLRDTGLVDLLNERVLRHGVPILGICLGMQLLTDGSEEGELPGLGWIHGRTIKFRFEGGHDALKVPHMGWNTVSAHRADGLFVGLTDEPRFYFVHSYYVQCDRDADVLGTTRYGFEFTSAVARDNVMGTQFHPEKSHKFGMALLRNFAMLPARASHA